MCKPNLEFTGTSANRIELRRNPGKNDYLSDATMSAMFAILTNLKMFHKEIKVNNCSIY